MRIFHQDVTASTNLDARKGIAGDVFVAEFQTAGRGRLDHVWHAAKGLNLTFSVVLNVGEKEPSEVATLPLVVGLAVSDAVKEVLGKSAALKWPNDVLVGGKKVCGILCERAANGVIAGIGVNVNQVEFPEEIRARATSIALEKGAVVEKDEVLAAILRALEVRHGAWARGGFGAVYEDFAAIDLLKGKKVAVFQTDGDEAPVEGVCGGVQKDGTLLVGNEFICAGEAHIKSWGEEK